MPHHTNIAERIAYGRPLEPEVEAPVPVVPRPMTALIGRILIAAIFIMSGIAKLTDTPGTVAHMIEHGIPYPNELALVAGVGELLAGLGILFGCLTRVAALGMIVFLMITTAVFHDFWNLTGAEQKTQMITFMKNLAILGGLIMIVAFGPGLYSIDAKLRRPLQP